MIDMSKFLEPLVIPACEVPVDTTPDKVYKTMIELSYESYDVDKSEINEWDMIASIERDRKDVNEFIEVYSKGEIPEYVPIAVNSYGAGSASIYCNTRLHDIGVYALITKEFAFGVRDALDNDAVLLDCMAGKGYLAKAFREIGIPTIATDDNSWRISKIEGIELMDALDAIEKYADIVTHVVIAWPPYDSPIGYEILKKAGEYGLKVIYIGEGEGGCTGDFEFHDHFVEDTYIDGYETLEFLHDYAVIGHYSEEELGLTDSFADYDE